jgi:hypothetical protein
MRREYAVDKVLAGSNPLGVRLEFNDDSVAEAPYHRPSALDNNDVPNPTRPGPPGSHAPGAWT